MKKFTLTMLLLSSFYLVQAQFVKGDRYLTGSFGFSYSKQDFQQGEDNKGINLSFSPAYIKFKTDRKANGIRMILNFEDATQSFGSTRQERDIFGAGLGVFRQTIFPLGKGFYFGAEKGANAVLTWGDINYTDLFGGGSSNNEVSGYNINLYLTPEVGYKLTDRMVMALNFSNILNLSFQQTKTEINGSNTETTTALSLSSSLTNTSVGQLGIRFGWKLK